MSNLAKIRCKYGEQIGVELFFTFPDLQDDQRTYLDADVASGLSSISANGVNFSTSQFIVIGQPGNVKTEIVQIHASTVPTSTAITLASALQFPHNRGDVIRFIPYNQIVPERSINSGSSYSALSAVNIRADSTETYLQRTGDASTDMYKFRFYNSSSVLYSAYSDVITASGFAANTVWSAKRRAMTQLGEQYSQLITDQILNDELYEARRTLDQDPRVFRWTFRQKFNQSIGNIVAGTYSIAVPTDLRDQNSYKNILGLRIGKENRTCVYQDQAQFRQNFLNVGHTTLNGNVAFGATTIVVTSSADLGSSGSIKISGHAVGDTIATITFTGNTKSTNTLTGVTGVPVGGLSSEADIWLNATFGLPLAYTVYQGYLYFNVPFMNSLDGQNIFMDYYKALPTITNDGDTFDEPFYDLYVSWLKWKIKYLKANGKIDRDTDADYKDWSDGIARVIAQEIGGQRIYFSPDTWGYFGAF